MVRQIERLSYKKISTIIKQGNYADGGGLYLQVSRFRTKSWVFRFTLKKTSREMGLGPLHAVTLSEARLKAEKCRKQVHEGIDPIEKRRKKISAKVLKSAKISAVNRARNHENSFNKIVSAIRDELEPHNMLNAAVSSITQVLNITGCRIYRRNKDDEFCTAAEYGDCKKIKFLELKLTKFSARKKLVDLDIGGFKFLAAATNYRKRVNGAISIWRYSNGKAWDKRHYSLIKEIANQLGIANEQLSNHERIIALSRTISC